jgi:hypothetical protein
MTRGYLRGPKSAVSLALACCMAVAKQFRSAAAHAAGHGLVTHGVKRTFATLMNLSLRKRARERNAALHASGNERNRVSRDSTPTFPMRFEG